MKLHELNENVSVDSLPSTFNSGDEFMEFVYDKWNSKKTHVEHQGGGAWMAEIHGDENIKFATYDEESEYASWLDQDHEEID